MTWPQLWVTGCHITATAVGECITCQDITQLCQDTGLCYCNTALTGPSTLLQPPLSPTGPSTSTLARPPPPPLVGAAGSEARGVLLQSKEIPTEQSITYRPAKQHHKRKSERTCTCNLGHAPPCYTLLDATTAQGMSEFTARNLYSGA